MMDVVEVYLTRHGDEPWGFRLIGGVDFDMPLTVVKVVPNSPADQAGLRNGDVVKSINDEAAAKMTHEDSRMAVAAAEDELRLGVSRGLYDPVLDEYEPIYDTIDQDDFDQPSDPTEVLLPDPKDLTDLLIRPPTVEPEFGPLNPESRSLTASPYVMPTKPYRPFSTEPIETIPALEEPIILNPDYNDDFSKLGIDEDFLPKTRFKLPISEQYDPDGTRKKGVKTETDKVEVTQDITKHTSTEMHMKETTQSEIMKEEVKFLEKMKSEIDLKTIEQMATSVVDESLQKATAVAEEIKNEIEVALHESVSAESKSIVSNEVSEGINKLVDLIDKTTDSIVKQIDTLDVNVSKQIENFETIDKHKVAVDEKKISMKQELAETIESGIVKRKSVALEKQESNAHQKDLNQTSTRKSKTQDTKSSSQVTEQHMSSKTTKTTSKTGATKIQKDIKKSKSKLLSEQRAYTIGLHTIPNIRGTIHSSYHFDMLLKTFFIHLTDVMVALSRFILSEPASTKDEIAEEGDEEETEGEEDTVNLTTTSDNQESSTQLAKTKTAHKDNVQNEIYKHEQQETVAHVIKDHDVELTRSNYVKENYAETNIIGESEKRTKSGSKMAQLVEKKSEELTHRMDAVISEFQDKAGIEEITTMTESVEDTIVETKSDAIHKSSKSKGDRATYVAVVESHVYTNEDTVFEEQFSETVSVQSGEETNMAVREIETGKSENINMSEQNTEDVNVNCQKMQEELHLTSNEAKEAAEKVVRQQRFDEMVSDQTAIKLASERIQEKILETASQEKNITKSILKKTMEGLNIQTASQETLVQKKAQEVGIERNSSEVVMKETSMQKAAVQQTSSQETAVKEQVSAQECIVQEICVNNFAISENVDAAPIVQEVIESVIEKPENKELDVVDYKANIKEEEAKALAVAVTEVNEEMAAVAQVNQKKEKAQVSENKEITFESAIVSNGMSSKTESNEFSGFKVSKEEVTEVSKNTEMIDKTEISINKYSEINELKFNNKSYQSKTETTTDIQESTFVAKAVETKELKSSELKLDTAIAQQKSPSELPVQSDENNNTSTPTTPVPPTPLTDEYIFKLQIPLPKGITPVPPDPRSPTPDDEDPHIVKKGLIPSIEANIENGIIYDPPLPTPPGSPKSPGSPTSGCRPVYTKPGLRGGADREEKFGTKEEILEIERKSSLLASAIDQTIKSIEEYKEEVGMDNKRTATETNGVIYNGYAKVVETKVFDNSSCTIEKYNGVAENPITVKNHNEAQNAKIIPQVIETEKNGETLRKENIEGYRPIQFDPEEIQDALRNLKSAQYSTMIQNLPAQQEEKPKQMYKNESGEIIGTHQGIVDGLEEAVVDPKVEDELGKPGMTEEKIAELISGESEMLREAHVMGLSRVLRAHMHRDTDDSSVDFKRIKPIVESLKDSEVLKALNEELIKTQEEKKKEERKWTTFLQKPKRPVPKAKFGYHGYVPEEMVEEPYKVKIVKQPKPKVAPDYKPEPEKFETGLLPWEERALREPTPPPVNPEDPILVPEEAPEILEAVDPLPESEVPDLEDSGIPLPPPKEPTPPPTEETEAKEENGEEEELDLEAVIEETEQIVEENIIEEMEQNKIADQLMSSVQNMVDPNAPLEQQLAQMRAQLAALAQLPGVIQQSLELVTRQLSQLSHLESTQSNEVKQESNTVKNGEVQETTNETATCEEQTEEAKEEEQEGMTITEVEVEKEEVKPTVTAEEIERMKKEELEMLEEQRRLEKQKKELMEEARREIEARQLKQRPTPRVGKPKPVFGPATPQERPLVLPGGRKWRKPKDAYNEQFIRDILASQAELIQGKTMGINFMKYEKPPISLDHLQNSDTYKMIHNMEEKPLRRVETLTPAISEADYRERCRSMTPCLAQEQHNIIPQQVQP